MAPRCYTELFFFDEATAIAAGHRPCHECRRDAFLDWQAAWKRAKSLTAPPRAPAMDNRLHSERIDPRTGGQQRWKTRPGGLPDGTFVMWKGTAHLIHERSLRHWTWQGYGPPLPSPDDTAVTVLTPPSSVEVLRSGYRPALNFSGNALKAVGESDI